MKGDGELHDPAARVHSSTIGTGVERASKFLVSAVNRTVKGGKRYTINQQLGYELGNN